MKNLDFYREEILKNNDNLIIPHVKKALILYQEKEFFIGDTCIIFDKFRACKLFFENATIDINFSNLKHLNAYRTLLKNNPNVDNILSEDWKTIDFLNYDVVICVTPEEQQLLNIIQERYQDCFINGRFLTSFFSFSAEIIANIEKSSIVFPLNNSLLEFSKKTLGPRELYVSNDEKTWANTWLKDHAFKEQEQLIVLIDSTSVRNKLLSMGVYYEILMWFLEKPSIKILIFDENAIGKDEFYNELLGIELTQKMIFSKCLSLRNAISLLSADRIKLVFGPCTGLMHCASGIYNYFYKTGLPKYSIPLLVTYTGKYHKEHQNAHFWWNNSPLMNCLIIQNEEDGKKMVRLSDLNEDERKSTNNLLFCAEYTSEMIIDYLDKNGI